MLLKTYDRIMELFNGHRGYMNFSQLKNSHVTIKQIQELESRDVIDCFSRGWYWCSECGYERPADYKYIEIAKVNPHAVICLDSACFKHGILSREPETVAVATERTDRRKMNFSYPVRRYYLQNLGNEGEIESVITGFGDYRIYSLERTICDCVRLKDKIDKDIYIDIINNFHMKEDQKMRIYMYAKFLRAAKNMDDYISDTEKLNFKDG